VFVVLRKRKQPETMGPQRGGEVLVTVPQELISTFSLLIGIMAGEYGISSEYME
jgi:hypothetical protein